MQLLIDSSYLFKNHLEHPDLQKLLLLSRSGKLRICIPHIVWEEHRTQLLESAHAQIMKLRQALGDLDKPSRGNIISAELKVPKVELWTDEELETVSIDAMRSFADENKIEILSIGKDHADRAWKNYFRAGAPFKREEKRENRRKDIPDSWILEAAIDLARENPDIIALCDDKKLSNALSDQGIQVFSNAEDVIDHLNGGKKLVVSPSPAGDSSQPEELDAILSVSRLEFDLHDRRVLGFIGHLSSPTKDQLFELLSRTGMKKEIAQNSADRLVIAGLIRDTGNHYLPANKVAAELAAVTVESEIISLLGSED